MKLDFNPSMQWMWPIEGGYWPGGKTDPNPTNFGITQKELTRVRLRYLIKATDVKNITKVDASLIYYNEYWTPSGCNTLPAPLDLIVFDMAVNCGVSNALVLLKRTTDPYTYIEYRLDHYQYLARTYTYLAPNLRGWENRLDKLRIQCHLPPMS